MATTLQQLNEARAAYHDLTIGQAARVFVDQNGERVEYVAANPGRLSAYIEELEASLGIASGRSQPRPARFLF